jgi:hypothetical protein
VKSTGMPDSEWPKLFCNRSGPTGHSMKQNCPSSSCDHADCPLYDPVLPMSTHSTKSQRLAFLITVTLEPVCGMDTIVSPNACNFDTKFVCKSFELSLRTLASRLELH